MKRLLTILTAVFALFTISCKEIVYSCRCKTPKVEENPVNFETREYVVEDVQGEEGVDDLKEQARSRSISYSHAKDEYYTCVEHACSSTDCDDEFRSVESYSADGPLTADDYWKATEVIECYEQ